MRATGILTHLVGVEVGAFWGGHLAISISILQQSTLDTTVPHLTYFFFNKFIYLFLAALGLRCSTPAFSSCGEWGLLLVTVHRLLIAVASLVAEHGL